MILLNNSLILISELLNIWLNSLHLRLLLLQLRLPSQEVARSPQRFEASNWDSHLEWLGRLSVLTHIPLRRITTNKDLKLLKVLTVSLLLLSNTSHLIVVNPLRLVGNRAKANPMAFIQQDFVSRILWSY